MVEVMINGFYFGVQRLTHPFPGTGFTTSFGTSNFRTASSVLIPTSTEYLRSTNTDKTR